MKIIIAEKVNQEILDWHTEEDESVHIISWTSDINYSPKHNETNLYQFMRQGPSNCLIKDLPWTRKFVLNYRSISGNHQLEFKDQQEKIVTKVFLRSGTQFVEKIEIVDDQGNTISNETYSNESIAQKIDYDEFNHPVEMQLIGKNKKVITYWHTKEDKIQNVGMSLVTTENEVFYNNYWDWHFLMFREIISSFDNVSEILSYEAPLLNTDKPNRQVKQGQLANNIKKNKWIINFQRQNYWKPRNDVSDTALTIGYEPINFDFPYLDKESWITAQLENHCKNIQTGDLVVWQYPKYSPQLELTMIKWFHSRKIKVVSFVHDISLLRQSIKETEHYSPEADKELLTSFDANIVPEHFVEALHKATGVSLKNIVALPPYDFIKQREVCPARYSQNIVYAGSLSKFPNLENIDFDLTVYGEKNFSDITLSNPMITDGGFMPAEELSNKLDNGFGLIWDEDKNNPYRKSYTKWNWPYKFSLYMTSGLPVLAWSGSAIANVIKEYELGILVDSLDQITHKVSCISETDYEFMAQNASHFGEKLSRGSSTKYALRQVEKFL
ncbi:glycosyl transferase [Leuconostoc citreum]